MTEFIDKILDNTKGCVCPACGRFAKVYRRRLNSTVAKQLIHLYRSGGDKDFIHSKHFVNGTGVGDLTKAKYFGLLESAPNDNQSKKTSGLWRLTEDGVDFVRGDITIPQYVMIYNDEVLGFSENDVFIKDSLGDKFDYQQLMND